MPSTTTAQSSSTRRGSTTSTTSQKKLPAAPLSASVLHYNDPFLPIERAARSLQNTIQSLLDIQSRVLNERGNGIEQDEITSAGSLTPTQSVITPRSGLGMQAVPIRQPIKRKVTLRGARKGLSKKMKEFADLRREELQVLETQSKARSSALERVQELEAKKKTCLAHIEAIRQEENASAASTLRTEANNVRSEIEELEHRILELRVRHGHLLDQANQLESSMESKISSFKATISMVDKEARDFLRRPPLPFALAEGTDADRLGMYALKPDRRTLEMADEQWSTELDVLAERTQEVEDEYEALVEGEQIWTSAAARINDFEQSLRKHTFQLSEQSNTNLEESMVSVLGGLEQVVQSLESDLERAESKGWNLLICAIGAELEAFQQARELLRQTQQQTTTDVETKDEKSQSSDMNGHFVYQNSNRLTNDASPGRRSGNGNLIGYARSNESLRDTLNEFSKSSTLPQTYPRDHSRKSESEDDEPPVDFLLSR